MGDDDDNDGKNDALEWVVRIMNLITILVRAGAVTRSIRGYNGARGTTQFEGCR